ncbi:MAG: LytR/AlgR family response regulator transcription factor [Bacteroidia bacterium]
MKNKIKALIVDDEKQAREILKVMISDYVSDIEIVGYADSVKSSIESINELDPELVFLDIDMADGFGFDVLNKTKNKDYAVVFTTAYSSYAAKAFEFAALHYLLKPIDIDALIESVKRYKESKLKITESQIEALQNGIHQKHERINIQINNEIVVFNLNDILYLASEEGTTILYLKENQVRLLPNSLNFYENLLSETGFYRTHAKYLLNLRNVSKFKSHGRNGFALISDQSEITVSSRKKTGFTDALKTWHN